MMGLECEVGVQGLRAGGYTGTLVGQGVMTERVLVGKSTWELKGLKLVTGLGVETELTARVLREYGRCQIWEWVWGGHGTYGW